MNRSAMGAFSNEYDVILIGGGLAGLSLSIVLAGKGYRVLLIEKEHYPFHKVCGEYISHESRPFLQRLGLQPSELGSPFINKLLVTAPGGQMLHAPLPLGGFGLSRYLADATLMRLARDAGVDVREGLRAEEITTDGETQCVKTRVGTAYGRVVAGCFGKRSNIDVRWKRQFTQDRPGKLNNFIAVKYHVKYNQPADIIALHNFKNGYCGISKVEGEQYCLCYLTTAKNLNDHDNSIHGMEEKLLCRNPFLKEIFKNADFVRREPLVISHISFEKKLPVEQHVLMLGDAAGMITPLCGNGMSMAIHAASLAAIQIDFFLQKKISRLQMEIQYTDDWNRQFGRRIRTGRQLQRLFGNPFITGAVLTMLQPFPGVVQRMILATHGQPF